MTLFRLRYWSWSRENAWFAVLPSVFLGLFFVLPLLTGIYSSFAKPTLSLANYQKVFQGVVYAKSLLYTLEIALSVTVLCLLLAYPLAYVIANAHGFSRKIMYVLVLLPLWISVVIRSYAWLILFQRRGVLNEFLLWTGLISRPLEILQTNVAVVIGMVHILLPIMILPLVSTMMKVDPTFLRAGRILGARGLRFLLRVYFPLTMHGVTAGSILVFILALGFFITPSLLGGGTNMMAAVSIEHAVSVFFDWPLASALSTLLLVVTSGIYLIYVRVVKGDLGALSR
jgi:ABC-type spermidine/putrescine transport system permease subunit I